MFKERRKKRAIWQYTIQLPCFLKDNYGGSGTSGYTEGQVRIAVKNLKLNEQYIKYAFLLFCGERVLINQGETSESILKMVKYLSHISSSGAGAMADTGGSGFLGGMFDAGGSCDGCGDGGGGGDGG
jgi:hypothetical protein